MLMANIFKPIRWLHAAADARDGSTLPPGAALQSGASRESRVGTQPVTNTSPSGLSAGTTSDVFAGTYATGVAGSLAGNVAGSWDAANEPAPSAEEDAWLALLELVFDQTGWPDAEIE
jgi:type IV secretory pathway TrbL component